MGTKDVQFHSAVVRFGRVVAIVLARVTGTDVYRTIFAATVLTAIRSASAVRGATAFLRGSSRSDLFEASEGVLLGRDATPRRDAP